MQVLINVQGKELPPYMLEKLNATPFHTFKITPETQIEYDDDGKPLPPEECFSKEFIKAVEASEQDIKAGRCKRFTNVDDLFKELNED